MPPKKDENGDWTQRRACGDYRGLNRVSITDHYQIPTPEEIFDVIGDAKVFTTLDFRQGYNQIKIAEKDRCTISPTVSDSNIGTISRSRSRPASV